MTRFFIGIFTALFLTYTASAQTPQQLEMLKNRGASVGTPSETINRNSERRKAVYFDETTGKYVIPKNPNPKIIPMEDGTKAAIPMEKTDQEVMDTKGGPDARILRNMSEDQMREYAEYLVQDRIFISTSDFRVITTVTGMKYCQMQLNVKNNTPRRLDEIRITYSWDDTKTSARFSNLRPMDVAKHEIALAGSVCDRVTKGARYNVDRCTMDGLTEEQCRLRIAEL